MKKYKVTINRELLCRVYHDTIVEAEGEDEAWEKACDEIDFGDTEVRDCIYSDDNIEEVKE